MNSPQEFKACPYCGEQILQVAIRCKHCHADLTAASAAAPSAPAPAATATAPADYLPGLIALPIVGALLAWFWVGNMGLIQAPGAYLWLIMILVIVGTAVLATIEDSKARGSTDLKWFAMLCLVWFIAYPAYLRKRAGHGLANMFVLGIIVAVGFIGSVAYLDSAITDAASSLTTDSSVPDEESDSRPAEHPAAPPDAEATNGGGPAVLASGLYSNAFGAVLIVSGDDPEQMRIHLVIGHGEQACVEGEVDCLEIDGVASRDGARFRFGGADGDCGFTLEPGDQVILVREATGSCGTGTANRRRLEQIDGDYAAPTAGPPAGT